MIYFEKNQLYSEIYLIQNSKFFIQNYIMIELYTIGFTKKNAKRFFELLTTNGVKEIVDTRVNNTSQLAGFAKADDLQFFAKEIADINYQHALDFAPTKELLSKYRKKELTWAEYEVEYLNLLDMRKVGKKTDIEKLHKKLPFVQRTYG